MRDGSNTVRPGSNIQRRVLVRVTGEATRAASEHFFPSVRIPRMAAATGLRRVGWFQEPHSNACDESEQLNPLCKLAGCPSSPSWQAPGIFQTDASTRTLCHGHRFSGFAGKNLSLKCWRITPVPLVMRRLFLGTMRAMHNGCQAATTVAIRSKDATPHPHVTAQPSVRLSHVSDGHFHIDSGVPLAILSEDLSTALGPQVEFRTRQSQCPVQTPMAFGGHVKATFFFCPFHHHPVIKAAGLLGQLHVGRVNQLRVQGRRGKRTASDTSGFEGPAVVGGGAPVGPAHKLTEPLGRTGSALCGHQVMCGIGMAARKEGRQARQAVCLVAGRVQSQFVRKIHRCHGVTITQGAERRHPPCGVLVRARPWATTVAQTPAAPTLLAPFARARAPRHDAPSKAGEVMYQKARFLKKDELHPLLWGKCLWVKSGEPEQCVLDYELDPARGQESVVAYDTGLVSALTGHPVWVEKALVELLPEFLDENPYQTGDDWTQEQFGMSFEEYKATQQKWAA